MPSIENIKGSDGTAETVRAVVTAQRAVSSTTIAVNSIVGFNTNFIGTTGGLDADNKLTIRPQVFFGHISGSNLVIDSFVPSYTDQGNEVGDIVVIKPTTAWADEIAALLAVSHRDDGELKPTGMVVPYAGATEPTGWLFTYGQAVSRTTYADLFTAIGTIHGAGDGTTTFNLPDLRGRVIAGQDDMGGTSANRLTGASGGVNGDVLGGAGGAETHTLTVTEMPSHAHSTGQDNLADTGSGVAVRRTDSAGGAVDTASTGGNGAHNNVQPTIILNYIIKT